MPLLEAVKPKFMGEMKWAAKTFKSVEMGSH